MLSETFDFAVVPFTLGISGLIFLCIGFILKLKYGYIGGIKTTGTMVGFLKYYNGHYIGVLNSDLYQRKHKGFSKNVENRKPIIRFSINNRTIVTASQGSVPGLGKKDIGKTLPIKYFTNKGGRAYKVIVRGKQYELRQARGRRIIFRIFSGVGLTLITFSVLAINKHLTLLQAIK